MSRVKTKSTQSKRDETEKMENKNAQSQEIPVSLNKECYAFPLYRLLHLKGHPPTHQFAVCDECELTVYLERIIKTMEEKKITQADICYLDPRDGELPVAHSTIKLGKGVLDIAITPKKIIRYE